jgi:hypothetical protein
VSGQFRETTMGYAVKDFVRNVTVAGITIAITFVGATLVFANSSYHTDWREGAWGVAAASSWLELLWIIVASILVVARWRLTTLVFRIVFVLNAGIAVFLIKDFVGIR